MSVFDGTNSPGRKLQKSSVYCCPAYYSVLVLNDLTKIARCVSEQQDVSARLLKAPGTLKTPVRSRQTAKQLYKHRSVSELVCLITDVSTLRNAVIEGMRYNFSTLGATQHNTRKANTNMFKQDEPFPDPFKLPCHHFTKFLKHLQFWLGLLSLYVDKQYIGEKNNSSIKHGVLI